MARKQNQTDTTATAAAVAPADEQTTSEQPTTEVAAEPKATTPKAKTPEQQAAALRREAGELRRSSKAAGGIAQLDTLADQKDADADAISPRKSGKSGEPRPTCKGTKKDGSPCTAKAMEGSEFCTDHRPVRDRFTGDEWAAFQQIDTATIVDAIGWGRALKMAKAHLAESSK